jgi:hypothetical protein
MFSKEDPQGQTDEVSDVLSNPTRVRLKDEFFLAEMARQ